MRYCVFMSLGLGLAIQTYHDYSHPQHRFMQQNRFVEEMRSRRVLA
jgi:hypothetical protein